MTVLAAGLLLCLPSCGAPDAGGPRHDGPRVVVLFATCSLNRGYLSPYNPEIRFTPNLQRLSELGTVVATKHRAEASISGVSFASLFSGTRTRAHGLYVHPGTVPEEVLLVGEVFREAGFDTLAYLAHQLTRDLNYDQGTPGDGAGRLTGDDPVWLAALQALRRDDRRRLFVVANDTQVHEYRPQRLRAFCERYPDECQWRSVASIEEDRRLFWSDRYNFKYQFEETTRRLGLTASRVARMAQSMEILYRATVHELDDRLGRVLARIEQAGFLDDAIVVFTADHGESMFRSDRPAQWSHLGLTTSDVIDVPLIVYDARWDGPRRYDHVTRSIDVLPTLAGLAGVALPAEAAIDGVDLSRALAGDDPPQKLEAFSHTGLLPLDGQDGNDGVARRFWTRAGRSAGVAVRSGDWVWSIPAGANPERVVAYDLARDPLETTDRFDPEDPLHRQMAEALRAYKTELEHGYRASPSTTVAGNRSREAELELLRSLGYIQ